MKPCPDATAIAACTPLLTVDIEDPVPGFRISAEGGVLPLFSETTGLVPKSLPDWEPMGERTPGAFSRPGPVDDDGAGCDFARSIINSLDAVIYTMDRDLCLTSINSGWQKMPPEHGGLKLDQAPEAGRSFLDYVAEPSRRAELREILASVLATGQSREFQASSPDRRHWAIRISPWVKQEEILGLVYTVTDQTSYRELQNQLFQAQKMETIGTLAAGVAHDFNNLIQAVRGNVDLLRLEPQMPRELLPHLQQIEQAARRAADITRQLLSFSHSSSESITVFDFNELVQEAMQLTRRTLHRQTEVRLQLAEQPLTVRMDATRAHQMLLNLCVNAQDAMPGGGQLTITNAPVQLTPEQSLRIGRPVGTPFLRCAVEDNGVGIPPEMQRRIFDAFFTTKAAGKGTGLGLSIVHCVVTQAGGFIEVTSTVGEGTTFHIYLPIESSERTAPETVTVQNRPRGSGRLLVVDDEELIRQFNERVLEASGFEVVLASNGEEALMKLLQDSDQSIDVLLTDYHMPRVNGIDLIQRARTIRPDLHCVLVTGYLEDAKRQRVEQAFKARILQKPYSINEAVSLIAELMDSPSADAPPAR
jgi:signal transduction histidine kinase/CheY-like chemotaxis protein